METGLLEIQATELMKVNELRSEARQMLHAIFDQPKYGNGERDLSSSIETSEPEMAPCREMTSAVPESNTDADLAGCFLRLPSSPLDRLSRYEIRLWRQVAQTLMALDQLDSRKPQERSSRLRRGCNLLMTSF
jgi:hypothetical protein